MSREGATEDIAEIADIHLINRDLSSFDALLKSLDDKNLKNNLPKIIQSTLFEYICYPEENGEEQSIHRLLDIVHNDSVLSPTLPWIIASQARAFLNDDDIDDNIGVFSELLNLIKNRPELHIGLPNIIKDTAKSYLVNFDMQKFLDLYALMKANPELQTDLPSVIQDTAKLYLEEEEIEEFSNFLAIIEENPELKTDLSPIIKDITQLYLNNYDVDFFSDLLEVLEDYPEYHTDLSGEITHAAKKYLDSEDLSVFRDFLTTLEDFPMAMPNLNGLLDDVSETAVKLLKEIHEEGCDSELFSYLMKVVRHNKDMLQATLPESDIIFIPRSAKTYQYHIALTFNRKSGAMDAHIACLHMDSLKRLKDYWANKTGRLYSPDEIEEWEHQGEESRKKALRIITNSLKELAKGTVPKHSSSCIIENSEALAGWATTQLKEAGYEAPIYKPVIK
jgi:hypothetical protein